MSDSKLKSRIRKFFHDELEPKGFVLKKPRIPERFLAGLRQGIEFQPGSGHLDRRFTLNIFWSFQHALDEGIAMHGTCRIGHITGNSDTWFSREDDKLGSEFEDAKSALVRVALPYLDKYSSIDRIVSGAASGEISLQQAFGGDAGWRHFNQGYCYAFLGKRKDAIDHYTQVIANHSDRPYAWVRKRREQAIYELGQLGA
jgi:hypothetical protein